MRSVLLLMVATVGALDCSDNGKSTYWPYNDPKILTLGWKGASVSTVTNSSIWSCMESITAEDRQKLQTITFSDLVTHSMGMGAGTAPVYSIEPGAFSWFASAAAADVRITVLTLSYNHLAELLPGSLDGLQYLQTLELDGNAISSLDGSAIPPSVQHLDLSANKLKVLAANAFSGLSNLVLLELSSNQITQIDTAFAPLAKLATLRLDNNLLNTLDGDDFKGLGQLFTLDLSSNQIENLTTAVFNNYLPQLVNLDLGYNQLNTINGTIFENLNCLSLLVMSANPISTVSNQDNFDSISANLPWQSNHCCHGTTDSNDLACKTPCSKVNKCLPTSPNDNELFSLPYRSYNAWAVEALKQHVPNFGDSLANDNNHSSLVVVTNSKLWTSCSTVVGANVSVTCTCADLRVPNLNNPGLTQVPLWNPTDHSCLCPLGFYSDMFDNCLPCAMGHFGNCNMNTSDCGCKPCSKGECVCP